MSPIIHREDLPETPDWILPDRTSTVFETAEIPPNIVLSEN